MSLFESLHQITIEVNGWDGSLEDYEIYEMEQFDELMYGLSPLEIVDKLDAEFTSMDEYFRFTIYGVESLDSSEAEELLIDNKKEILERYNELLLDGEIEDLGLEIEE